MNPFGIGGNIREKKQTDYHPDSFKPVITGAMATVTNPGSFKPIIYMQDKYPTCGGHAPAPAANILFSAVTSPKYMWDEIKEIDGVNPVNGTTMDAIFKSWKYMGICSLSLLPNYLGASLNDYTKQSNITNTMIVDARNRKISNYAFVDNPSWQQIKDNLAKFKVAILLVDCGDGWWKSRQGQNSYAEADILPLRVGTFVSHHFVCALDPSILNLYGINNPNPNYIYFVNSWSSEWGHNGIGYFDISFIHHVKELGVPIVSTPQTPAQPSIQPIHKYQFLSDINYKDTSADVHQLQIRLGMPAVFQTGYFGPITLGYVVKYEVKNGLPISSVVNAQMRELLNS